MLRLDALPDKTRELLRYFQGSASLKPLKMTLFGGTALALLLGHRLSEDLDFFCFEPFLPKAGISQLLASLRAEGFVVTNTMDPVRISQARINDIQLDDFIQEFNINGVRVSFGTLNKGGTDRRVYFAHAPVVTLPDDTFQIPSLQTLFESKAVVLMDRVMSRDLFDLMTLIQTQGFSVQDIVEAIMRVDQRDQNEAMSVLEVLVGNVPVVASDPGFATIGLDISLRDIYAFFIEQVNAYERELARSAVDQSTSDEVDTI